MFSFGFLHRSHGTQYQRNNFTCHIGTKSTAEREEWKSDSRADCNVAQG